MDLDEWELLPNNGAFNFDLHNSQVPSSSNPNCIIDMDYFKKVTQNNKISTSREIGEIPVEEKKILEDQSSSQVFFKNEFADMKLDSPKGSVPQIVVGNHQFEEKEEEEGIWEDDNGGLNVWRWAMNGFGAFFSFGFVAVTVSLIVLGHSRNAKDKHTQNKRMKQMIQHATKLNEVINEVVGAPMARADITIGGSYYEAL